MRLWIVFLLGGSMAACSSGSGIVPSWELPDTAQDLSKPPPTPEVDWTDGLTLDEALALALTRNPRLRATRYDIDQARAQRIVAGTFPYNPELSLEGGHAPPFSRPEDYSLKLGIRQTFETGGQRGDRISLADENLERSRSHVADAERRIRGEVTGAFTRVLFLRRRAEIATDNAGLAEKAKKAAEDRFKAKQIPEIDVNLVKLDYQKTLVEKERANRELGAARANLASLLGDPKRVDLEAKGDLAVVLVILDKEKLAQAAQERRSDLKALRSLVRMAEHRVELERSTVWPNVTVGVFGERDVSRFPVGGADETDADTVLGLELSFPLPLWNRRRGEILEAEVEQRRLGVEAEALTQEIRRDVELAVSRLALAKNTLDIYEKELNTLSKQNLDDMEKAYRAGEVGTLEFLRAREDFNRISLGYVEAQFELRIALADLELAAGASLEEIK